MDHCICLVNSANYLKPEHTDKVVVCGSHGGLYCGAKAVACRVRGIILHDAGFCLDNSGIASLEFCQPHLIPVAVVDSDTAFIGNVQHTYEHGIISACNPEAARLGVKVGQSCAAAAELMVQASPHWQKAQEVVEHRYEVSLGPGLEEIVCLDSASLIQPQDKGRIVVTGSHGGLIGGNPDKCINVPARFAAFNDAGFGFAKAGAGRLAPLNERGILAVLVAAKSARIGDGRSTLYDGRISATNGLAAASGFSLGLSLQDCLLAWQKSQADSDTNG